METKTKKERKGKKKFVWSIILLVLALAALSLSVYLFLHVSEYKGKEQSNLLGNSIFFLVAALLLMGISCYLNWAYRSENENPGVFSLIIFIITVIPTGIIVGLLYCGYRFVKKWKEMDALDRSSRPNEVKIKTDDGKEITLKHDSYNCYKDKDGNRWEDKGNGRFERE